MSAGTGLDGLLLRFRRAHEQGTQCAAGCALAASIQERIVRALPRSKTSPVNGAKSTGPKTEAGKRRSSRNNRRYDFLANTVVLDAENRKDFLKTLHQLHRNFNPLDHYEESLIETMAIARWRHFRLLTLEKAGTSSEIAKHEATADGYPARVASAFRGLTDQSRWNDVIGR